MPDEKQLLHPDDSQKILKQQMDKTMTTLSAFLDAQGISRTSLSAAMDSFVKSLPALPEDTACKSGCAYCCHLRVGVSIPEALVLFNTLKSQATEEGFDYFRNKVRHTAEKGNTLEERFWLSTQTPCPFLDKKGTNQCLIYALRPFSCRAYHSTDLSACRDSFETGRETQIPCFPLYRAFTDLYTTAFIRVLAEKGLASFQVGFVRALSILFADDTAADRWLKGENVFAPARIDV